MEDPKKYAAEMEKALARFDSIVEWQDLVVFLTRISKLLANYSTLPTPTPTLLSKRLAQALNPALPSGVHIQALEVYIQLLKSQNPSTYHYWSYGLFPLGLHCSTTVKPLLIEIYSKFYIPLGQKLCPIIKAFILATLPFVKLINKVEEENNERFEQCLLLLKSASQAVGYPEFYGAIWKSIIISQQSRLPALNFLLKKMPKVETKEDLVTVCGNEISDLSLALGKMLDDQLVLVKRGCLELMVTQFPLALCTFSSIDRYMLVESAISIVLVKDISLNKRLFVWIKDSDEDVVLVLKVLAFNIEYASTGSSKGFQDLNFILGQAGLRR